MITLGEMQKKIELLTAENKNLKRVLLDLYNAVKWDHDGWDIDFAPLLDEVKEHLGDAMK